MTRIHVYYPKSVAVLKKWLERVKKIYEQNTCEYLIVNEEGRSMDLDEYLQPFAGKDLSNFKGLDVLFVYPENGKSVDEIRKFVEFIVDLSKFAHIDIYTVSDWMLTFINLYLYIGEMTIEERKKVKERFGITKYIRYEDIRVEWLSYNDKEDKFEYDRMEASGVPPMFDFIYEDQSEELSSLFVGLRLIYDDFRTEE
jgi:hypothetical protein